MVIITKMGLCAKVTLDLSGGARVVVDSLQNAEPFLTGPTQGAVPTRCVSANDWSVSRGMERDLAVARARTVVASM